MEHARKTALPGCSAHSRAVVTVAGRRRRSTRWVVSAVGVADEHSGVDLEVYTLETIPLDLRTALAARLADPSAPIEFGNDT